MKDGGPNFEVEQILENVWIVWSLFLDIIFKTFLDGNSSSFIPFQCILHGLGVLFSESWNFKKSKMGKVISGENEFCRMSQIFGLSFCISILKVLWTQILFHSLDFSHFRSTFLRVLKFLQIKDGRPNIWWEPILQHVLIIWSPFSYFNLRSSMNPISSSFIRFQCFLHDSEVLFPESWNF